MAGKRNADLDREAQEWIEAVIEEKFPKGVYDDVLKDGILLCKYSFSTFCSPFLSSGIPSQIDEQTSTGFRGEDLHFRRRI